MLPELNLAYVFLFRSNTNFIILLQKPATETMATAMSTHKSTRPCPRMPKAATTTLSKLVSFFCCRQTVLINQPLKSLLFLHLFTSQTLILVVQSVVSVCTNCGSGRSGSKFASDACVWRNAKSVSVIWLRIASTQRTSVTRVIARRRRRAFGMPWRRS